MTEYNWTSNDLEILSNSIPGEHLPTRFALTGTMFFTKKLPGHSQSEILLCNPHPDSWNNWLLPYGAFTLESSLESISSPTFDSLSSFLKAQLSQNSSNYKSKIQDDVSKLLGLNYVIELESEPLHTNFSLKFSKTSSVWTAYYFLYHKTVSQLNEQPVCQHIWLPLNEQELSGIQSDQTYQGLKVAGNVVELLANPRVLTHL